MRMRLLEMIIFCKKSQETIQFDEFSYFYGEMGTGKSSIARLIDYCFGGELEYTPALQSEFVAVTLSLIIKELPLSLYRQNSSNEIHAQWEKNNETFDVIIPARRPNGEVISETGVEVVSDLIFYLAGIRQPKVRRSKIKEDSELERLSLRDLMWYCYLDQDTIDSSFFNLDAEANLFKRLKSRDVLRFIVGYHQEGVSELESQLEEVRTRRLGIIESAKALTEGLSKVQIASDEDIQKRIDSIKKDLITVQEQIEKSREKLEIVRDHAGEQLSNTARKIALEIESLKITIDAIENVIDDDKRHTNEITSLLGKFRRTVTARAVLNGVEFETCPRCTQTLPNRGGIFCRLCGQSEQNLSISEENIDLLQKDADARRAELEDAIKRHTTQLKRLKLQLNELLQDKGRVDTELNFVMKQYDSAYLSSSLTLEHKKASLDRELIEIDKYKQLWELVKEQVKSADILAIDETRIRRELRELREKAEQDKSNLKKLEKLYLDCLVRAKIPGFTDQDTITIKPPHFMPEVISPDTGEIITTSFSNLGSGGKKTLFKCCFAIAIHRLAVEVGAVVPNLLIIDSPMKNISERENRQQFVEFHQLLYELKNSQLKDTQFILIDKEICQPPKQLKINMTVRHMTPENALIHYYKGH